MTPADSTPAAELLVFAFCDLEGSTEMVRSLGDITYGDVLRDYRTIIGDHAAAEGGEIADFEGDGIFLIFPTAAGALRALASALVALDHHAWPDGIDVRPRVGVHAGEARRIDGDWVGLDIHRAARIGAVAWGRQIVVSEATRVLASDGLDPGLRLLDLGPHRLKDFDEAEALHQLTSDALPDRFPPLRTTGPTPNNLPAETTSFVGRAEELAEMPERIRANRLLTLTGVGGVGKTRLAIEGAGRELERFPDGVWLIELAPLTNPDGVADQVARSLGLVTAVDTGTGADRETLRGLIEHLRDRSVLLVLDNCEHVLGATAALLESLLRSCPKVHILATSREGLGVSGEAIWQLPSLGVNDDSEAETDAVVLFAERARAATPAFTLTDQTRPVVSHICRRLDGIPLAIELAARRTKVLEVDRLAERLDDTFRILTGGSRTALPRQQTLEAAIDWSYALLTDAERLLFRRLSVFAGGFTLEAAEAVCSGDGVDDVEVLDLLSSLVDKSLVDVRHGDAGPERYGLLETLRHYARTKLVADGDEASVRRRHLDHFEDLAVEVEPSGWSIDLQTLRGRVESEVDNLQSALDRATETGVEGCIAVLASVLAAYWGGLGHTARALALARAAVDTTTEGTEIERRALRLNLLANLTSDEEEGLRSGEQGLSLLSAAPPSAAKVRASIDHALRLVWSVSRDPREAAGPAREAVATARDLGDRALEIVALRALGEAHLRVDGEEGLEHIRASVDVARATGDQQLVFRASFNGPFAALFQVKRHGDEYEELTERLWEWCLEQESGVTVGAWLWFVYAWLRIGNWERAETAQRTAAACHVESYAETGLHHTGGLLAWMRGRLDEAEAYVGPLRTMRTHRRWFHDTFSLLADIEADRGRPEAARAFAEEYLAEEVHATEQPLKAGALQPVVRADIDHALRSAGSDREASTAKARETIATIENLFETYPPPPTSPHHEHPTTHLLAARAELSRATEPDPALWRRLIDESWMIHTRTYARFRRAEALIATGQREEGEAELHSAHGDAVDLGAERIALLAEHVAQEHNVSLGR